MPFTKGHTINIGHKFSEESKRKMSQSRLGIKYSDETRLKMSIAFKGRKAWNKGIFGEKAHRWKGGNENTLFLNRQRKNKVRASSGQHTREEWENLKRLYQHMCLCCKRQEPEIVLTEDHIIPVSRGGTNDIWNIQPLCKSCNCRKFNKTIDYREETYAAN